MEYIPKKTTEITDDEKWELLSLFNSIFDKNRTIEVFLNQYVNNILGYSYHILAKDKGRIIGHAADVPAYYFINGVKKIFVDGIDGFVVKEYRDAMTLIEMIQANRDNLKKNGVSVEFGFPNTYAMKVYTKGKIYTKVGEIHTYMLPYRIGGIKKGLKIFNLLSIIFSRLLVSFGYLFASKKVAHYKIEKDEESYNATRYKRMDGVYSRVQINDFEFMYKVKEHEGIRTAFLIDVTKKSARNFYIALRYIIKHNMEEFDLLLYVGNLPFKCHGMIKVPQKFKPKEFNLAIKILDKSLDKETLLKMNNWDVNLSNYDLL